MSSPPLPSAPLADRLAWMAAEARSEKAEAGMIVAVFIEIFARLLSRLAGVAARIAAGAAQALQPRGVASPAITAPVAATVSPGLLPRVFGWLGGLLPGGGPIVTVSGVARPDLPVTRTGRERSGCIAGWVSAQPRAATTAPGPEALRATEFDWSVVTFGEARESLPVPAVPVAWVARGERPPVTWRGPPASTAGPSFSKRELRPPSKHVQIVTIS